MKLILIRHGKTLANEKKLYCGSTDISLSKKGIKELRAAKKKIDYPDASRMQIVTSGKKRCEETLAILYGDVSHRAEKRFAEMDLGAFEMFSYKQLRNRPDFIEWITGDNEANKTPGGESGNEMTARVIEALNELIAAGEDTLLVTHGGVIAAIMAHLFPNENKNRYEWQPESGRGYVVEIESAEKRATGKTDLR